VRCARRALPTALVIAALAGYSATSAVGDADPASDILISFPVFYPYGNAASKDVQGRLEDAVERAADAKRPVKVAIIAAPEDLGSVGTFYGKPQLYARFLGQEIGVGYFEGDRTRLLVVLSAGFGLYAGPKVSVAGDLARLRRMETGTGVEALATAAAAAVERLNGVNPPVAESVWRDRLLIVGGVVAVVLAAIALNAAVARVRRGRPAPGG
jgi:hypothetical protein